MIDTSPSLHETLLHANEGFAAVRTMSTDYRQGMHTVLLMDAFEHSMDGLHPTYDLLELHGVFRLAGTWRGLVISRKPYFMPWCGEGNTLSRLLKEIGGKNFQTLAELPPQIVALEDCGTPILLRAQNSRNREGHGRRFGETSPYLLIGLTKE